MQDSSTRRNAAIVVVLLFFFMLINFADKAAIGLVAVPLMQELQLSPQAFGLVGGTFFSLFAISGIAFGFLSNHVASKPLIALLAIVWTVAQFPLAFGAVSLSLLIACRVLLGAGEGPAYPLALHACYKWVPDQKRNVPTAVIMLGGQVGMLVAGPVVTLLTIHYGWRASFLVLGCASLVWVLFWQLFTREGSMASADPTHDTTGAVSVPYRRLLLDPTYLGNLVVYWAAYWVVALVFTWIPSYLQKGLAYSPEQSGWIFSLFVGITIPVILIGSFASEKLLHRGTSSRMARGVMTASFTLTGAVLILIAIQGGMPRALQATLLAIGCSLPQISFILCSAVVGEMSPLRQRGAALAINNSIATTAGLIAPIVMGWFVQTTSGIAGYHNGLLCAALVLAVGGMVCLFTVNPARSKVRVSMAAPTAASV